jgi:hypothetical protein
MIFIIFSNLFKYTININIKIKLHTIIIIYIILKPFLYILEDDFELNSDHSIFYLQIDLDFFGKVIFYRFKLTYLDIEYQIN